MKRSRVAALFGIAFAAIAMAGCPEDSPTDEGPVDLSAVPSAFYVVG
jgi:hypothetical protein